jgi:hypothetical protein
MFNRRVVLRASGAFLGLVIAAGTVTSLSALVLSNRTEYLTFSGAVSLPGVTLNRGTYTFEVANSEASADIVRVRNRATNAVVFLGFTYRVERPRGTADNRSIVFGEAPRGVVPPILEWYPGGDRTGHQFRYSQTR